MGVLYQKRGCAQGLEGLYSYDYCDLPSSSDDDDDEYDDYD